MADRSSGHHTPSSGTRVLERDSPPTRESISRPATWEHLANLEVETIMLLIVWRLWSDVVDSLDDQVEKKAWSLERLGLLAEKSGIQDELEDSNLRHKHALREIGRLKSLLETKHAERDEADAKDARMYLCLMSVSDCPMSSVPFFCFACMATCNAFSSLSLS